MSGPSGDGEATPAATVEGLEVAFGDVSVFADVSLTLDAGTTTALVGPNGSGKSTLLRAIAELQPARGRVSVSGGTPRTVGYLPQNPQFLAGFTVRETVETYAHLLPDVGDPDAALARVGLDAANRRVEALSGGMRRLLAVGIALLGDPPLLLLDEPTSDLDPVVSAHVFDVIDDLAADGTAVLLATHDDRSLTHADRVLALQDGTLTEPPVDLTVDDPLAALFDERYRAEARVTADGGDRE